MQFQQVANTMQDADTRQPRSPRTQKFNLKPGIRPGFSIDADVVIWEQSPSIIQRIHGYTEESRLVDQPTIPLNLLSIGDMKWQKRSLQRMQQQISSYGTV